MANNWNIKIKKSLMNNPSKSLDNKVYQWLTSNRGKKIVLFLSHSKTHCIILLLISFLGLYMLNLATSEVGPEYHEVKIDFRGKPLNGFSVNVAINSDSARYNHDYDQNLKITTYPIDSVTCDINIEGVRCNYQSDFSVIRSPHNSEWILTDFSDEIIKTPLKISKERDYIYQINKANNSILDVSVLSRQGGLSYMNIYGDELFAPSKVKENPYYYFYLRIDHSFPENFNFHNTSVGISMGNYIQNGDSIIFSSNPIKWDYIYPEPDIINFSTILYYSRDKINEICKNRGIIIQAEDIKLKNKADRKTYVYAILLGAIIALWLEIFIRLIIKWKSINMYKE